MDVVTSGPFHVGSVVWQPRPLVFVLTIVCKATFTLCPIESPLAPDQDPLNETDDHWNDDAHRSLNAASDLVPFKRRADVLLVGYAYAPRGKPASSFIARLIVGDIDKSIEVHADRVWSQSGQLREGPAFTKMPLHYERAGGGPGTSNPVGVSPDARPDIYGQVPIPNLQPVGLPPLRRGEVIAPVGFGPIAPTWPDRLSRLYHHAARWDHQRWHERPLPSDIDASFFNVAPSDQQTSDLRSNERLVLENLHPSYPRLLTSLPGHAPRAMVDRAGAAPYELQMKCDTLSIDTDRGVCSLVWRGQVPLTHAHEKGCVLVTTRGASDEPGAAAQTLVPLERARPARSALPFDAASASRTTMPAISVVPPPLPFREGGLGVKAVLGRADESSIRRVEEPTGTLMLGSPEARVALPFAPRNAEPEETTAVTLVPLPAPVATPMLEADLAPPATIPRAAEPYYPPPLPFTPPRPLDDEPVRPMVAPPPLIADVAVSPPPPEPSGEPREAPVIVIAAVEPAPPKDGEASSIDACPIERCAAIAASCARRRQDKAKILDENGLTASQWEKIEKHWEGAIREEAKRGRAALLGAYDAAYVEQLEQERGPLRVEDYARLVVAIERGSTDDVLEDLTLPRGAVLRIRRVWLEKLATDTALAGSAARALEDARAE